MQNEMCFIHKYTVKRKFEWDSQSPATFTAEAIT